MPESGPSLIRRCLLGLWFCGIAVLGVLQFFGKAFRGDGFHPGTIAWIWLAGSVVFAALGIAAIFHELRDRPRRN